MLPGIQFSQFALISIIIIVFLCIGCDEQQPASDRELKVMVHQGAYGTCCKELQEVMEFPPESFFRVEENGVLYLAIGQVRTNEGPGYFDQAVIFCPFCGKQLQTKDDIKRKAGKE